MALPTVLESHRIGNRGEAFLEFLMSQYCLMNKVVGYRDVGIDYICEWLNGDTPSRILFGIQVKTTERNDINLDSKGVNRRLNELETFEIKKRIFNIEPKTFEYWKGLNIPLYLFLVVKNKGENNFDCYYSRLTPILHKNTKDTSGQIDEVLKGNFYKANDGGDFISVKTKKTKSGGFIRDLFIDSVRCSYQSGSVSYRDPEENNINWPNNVLFPDVLAEQGTDYIARVKKGLLMLQKSGLIEISPKFDEKIEELKNKIKGN
jgi:hypothetical protein